MPSISTRFKGQPGDFGSEFVALATGSFNTITANTTTRYGMGGLNDKDDTSLTRAHMGYVDEIFVGCITIPVDSDGTVLLNVRKYDASASADVVLVTGFNLEGLTAKKVERVPFDSGVTDAQRTMETGDFLFAEVVSNSAAIDTATVGMIVNALVKLLK